VRRFAAPLVIGGGALAFFFGRRRFSTAP